MTDDEMNELNNNTKIKAFISFTKGEGLVDHYLKQQLQVNL